MIDKQDMKQKVETLAELGFPISTISKHTGLGHARFYNMTKNRSAKFSMDEKLKFDLYYELAKQLAEFDD